MIKKHLLDPGIWLLLGLNIAALNYYTGHPDGIHTLIALFWIQSALIGIFNAMNLITLQKTVPGSFTINESTINRPGCAGMFFLLHYGFFHVMYVFFLVPRIINPLKIDWAFLRISFWFLLAALATEFIQTKRRNQVEPVNIGAMFFMPYARIIPMHLIIVTPGFFKFDSPIVFIVLKTVADIITYLIYQNAIFKKQESIKTEVP